jgi:hypothetical protein
LVYEFKVLLGWVVVNQCVPFEEERKEKDMIMKSGKLEKIKYKKSWEELIAYFP